MYMTRILALIAVAFLGTTTVATVANAADGKQRIENRNEILNSWRQPTVQEGRSSASEQPVKDKAPVAPRKAR